MKLTKAEAINLILGFFTTPTGFWKDVEYHDIPEFYRFMEANLTCIDKDDNRKIVPNENGKEILFSHFNEIAKDFISFMLKNRMECPSTEVVNWFIKKYNLRDNLIGEDIAFYIANKLNLNQFGYICRTPFPNQKEKKFIIQKSF